MEERHDRTSHRPGSSAAAGAEATAHPPRTDDGERGTEPLHLREGREEATVYWFCCGALLTLYEQETYGQYCPRCS